MAAMRSALLMLGRRISSGSSAAASMVGGRGPELHKVLRPSTPSLPLLRPSARNLELQGLQRFSTRGMGCADQKNRWWQRLSDNVETYACVPVVFGIGFVAGWCYLALILRAAGKPPVYGKTIDEFPLNIMPGYLHVYGLSGKTYAYKKPKDE